MRWIFELADIKTEGLNFSWEGPGENLTQAGDGLVFHKPLAFKLHLDKNNEQVLVKGELNTVLKLTCCRCLKNYPFAVNEKIFTLFIPQGAQFPQEEQELGAEELNLNYYSGDSLDLTDILRDQLLLSVPMTPRCREECPGLCPICGQDKNQGPCRCPVESKSSPFEALKKLKF